MYKILLFIGLLSLTLTSENLRVSRDNLHLVDPQGRTRLYHGVNVVYKLYPYYPEYDGTWNTEDSFNEQDVQYLKEWGFNSIRLYMAWEGVEPTESSFNMDYINNIKNIVSMCEKAGISVLLDLHQDVYSNFFCGEGLPKWAVESVLPLDEQDFPKPFKFEMQRDAEGYPIQKDCYQTNFFNYYYSYDVNKLSQDLLTNVNNLADKMGQFWQFVALQFKDTPNILGYEIINEPWGIDIWNNPLIDLIPGNQQNEYLLPFYQRINEYIRTVDKTSLLFFEPMVNDILNQGFDQNVGGPAYQQLEVFSYHIYCPTVDEYGQPTKPLICTLWDNFYSNGKQKDFEKIGVAGWLSEFGATGNTEEDANELDKVLGNADKVLNSWSYWQYKYFNDITTAAADPSTEGFWDSEGQLQSVKVAALSRAYAQKTCGDLIKQSWNRKKQNFQLEVKLNRTLCTIDFNTELFLSETFHYQNGFNAVFKNCDSCSLESLGEKSYYKVVGDDQIQDGTTWTLKVTPK